MSLLSNTFRILTFLFVIVCSHTIAFGQKKKIAKLPDHLKEISGLTFLNDTVLVAHNDSGNDPILYFLNLNGKQIHSVTVENATNKDWEDITSDENGTIYIGDIGNNNNNRTDLCIYKVSGKEILTKETVKAEKISFSYPDQKCFPPEKKDLYYDSEAIAFANDSIFIYTKCWTEPWDGKSYCYTIPTKTGTYKANKKYDLVIGKTGWWKDAITAVEIKNQTHYLLTYNRLIVYQLVNGNITFDRRVLLGPVSQNEALAINSKGLIYMADEKSKLLGGGYLYSIKIPKKHED